MTEMHAPQRSAEALIAAAEASRALMRVRKTQERLAMNVVVAQSGSVQSGSMQPLWLRSVSEAQRFLGRPEFY